MMNRTHFKLLAFIFVSALFATHPAFAAIPTEAGIFGEQPEEAEFFRLDCRFHIHDREDQSPQAIPDDGIHHGDFDKDRDVFEKFRDRRFCYASAMYRIDDHEFRDVHLGVGCDDHTIYNDHARVQMEQTLDRISPHKSATPAVEVFPHGQLLVPGTYTSVLDIFLGRIKGLCYVHKVERHGKIVKP